MIAYHIDPLRRVVTTRVSGRLTLADLTGHMHQLLRDPKFRADYNALIIAMDLEAVPSANSVATFAPLVRAWSNRRAGAKWAFVLPTPATRTFAETALNEVRLSSIITRCFLAESSALAWLDSSTVAPQPCADS